MTSTTRDHVTTDDDPLQAEAANWFVRLNTREPDTEEVADWQRWLMASEANRHAFARFEELWQTIGHTEQHFVTQERRDGLAPVAAQRSPSRRRWPLAIAAATLVAVVGVLLMSSDGIRSADLPASAIVQTTIDQVRTFALPDGSRVDVGASTRLVVDFSDSVRRVIIDDGDAYFQVVHDTERPFVVHAGSGTITAVGTAFNVHHTLGRVAVAVVEGAVTVRKLDQALQAAPIATAAQSPEFPQPLLVRAGEGVEYGRSIKAVAPIDTRVATAWRQGQLKFIREPLVYVAADVQRYSHFQISIADPAVAEFQYTGAVTPDEIEDWLALLPHAFPIEVQRINSRAVLLKLRADQPALSNQSK